MEVVIMEATAVVVVAVAVKVVKKSWEMSPGDPQMPVRVKQSCLQFEEKVPS